MITDNTGRMIVESLFGQAREAERIGESETVCNALLEKAITAEQYYS